MSMPSIDPGDYTPDQLNTTEPIPSTPRVLALRCPTCRSEEITRLVPLAVCLGCGTHGPEEDFLVECQECGDDFDDEKLHKRRAFGHDVCLGCAQELNLALDPDDANDLAEEYWTAREARASR